jgi:hypothetical protein
MLRIKTEKEFEEEFGNNWREIVHWNDPRDAIFGWELLDKEVIHYTTYKHLDVPYNANSTSRLQSIDYLDSEASLDERHIIDEPEIDF